MIIPYLARAVANSVERSKRDLFAERSQCELHCNSRGLASVTGQVAEPPSNLKMIEHFANSETNSKRIPRPTKKH